MTNVINLREYREAKIKAKKVLLVDELAKLWITYLFMLAGI